MAVYHVFRALGLQVKVNAILADDTDDDDDYNEDEDEDEDQDEDERNRDPRNDTNTNDTITIAGRLGNFRVSQVGGHDGWNRREIIDEWGGERMNVTWVNEREYCDIDMVHLTVSIFISCNLCFERR